jgi:hydroxymethylpyrimidine pyrophosphatase-like HAD family hydrolase
MRFLALACSYDETVASGGRIDEPTVAGLRRLVASGRHLLLLSRRPLDDLLGGLPGGLFAWVVAEHGGLLYDPGTRSDRPLADPLPEALLQALRRRSVRPPQVGRVSVAAARRDEPALRQALAETGLDLAVVADKDVVLALPHGIDKASGLEAACGELGLSPHNVAGVGDAESDRSFLRRCECAVAVANAPEALTRDCDLVTERPGSAGVVELIDRLVGDDLAGAEPRLARHRLLLGHDRGGAVLLPAYGSNVLLAGPSGTGKSKLLAGLLERLAEQGYQFLVLDPEGDHVDAPGAAVLGDRHTAPTAQQVLAGLQDPRRPVVANLLARRLDDLPGFLRDLQAGLLDLRTRTGRPHWTVLDEAHHFLPLPGGREVPALPRWTDGLLLATVNPEHVAPAALSLAGTVLTFGDDAGATLRRYCQAIGEPAQVQGSVRLPAGEALCWRRADGGEPVRFRIAAGRTERRPHLRRWAESQLDEGKSLWLRGPEGRLNLRAATLSEFVRLAEGVDDGTWLHHLRRGDYSTWFRDGIRDEALAERAAEVERDKELPAGDSRLRVVAAIRERYLEERR